MVDNLQSRVEIFLACRALQSKDTFSKSDPMIVVSMKSGAGQSFQEIGRTEEILDNENPDFKTRIVVDYNFETNQELMFDVFDIDSSSKRLEDHDHLGYVHVTLANLVAAQSGSSKCTLRKRGTNATIPKSSMIIRVEELSDTKDFVHFSVAGDKLDKMDLFGKSDAYLQFFRMREDSTWVQIHQTEIVMSSLNPRWKPFTLTAQQLCNGDMKRPLKVMCWDWDKNSAHDFIGEFSTTLKEMTETKEAKFVLTRPNDKNVKKRTTPHGTIIFNRCEYVREYSFLDFIKGGMQIGLQVAIDFTGSNGAPDDPSSLHYRHGRGMNEYQHAIQAIGSIVLQYDTDGRVPVWGFGGKVKGEVSHCFPLTLNQDQIEVQGVGGILQAYDAAFKHVLLSGPTLFSEVIRTSETIASQPYSATLQHYTVLLIITDGVINDMNETIGAIISASDKPLSIIIVGVGNADFTQMNQLDGDDVVLEYKGKKVQRDIVQFVPMREFKNKHISLLAKETLAEVPKQVVGFCKKYNIHPMKPQLQQMKTLAGGGAFMGAPPAGEHKGEFKQMATMVGTGPGMIAGGGAPVVVVQQAPPPQQVVIVAGPPPQQQQQVVLTGPGAGVATGPGGPTGPGPVVDQAMLQQQAAMAEQRKQLEAQQAALQAQMSQMQAMQAQFAQMQASQGQQPVVVMMAPPGGAPPGPATGPTEI